VTTTAAGSSLLPLSFSAAAAIEGVTLSAQKEKAHGSSASVRFFLTPFPHPVFMALLLGVIFVDFFNKTCYNISTKG
jgi:hypothetical protein